MKLTGGPKTNVEIDMASNSTVEKHTDISVMTTSQLNDKLYQKVLNVRPVNIMAKLPTLDDVRAVINSDFTAAYDPWKHTAPKKVTSRYVANMTS